MNLSAQMPGGRPPNRGNDIPAELWAKRAWEASDMRHRPEKQKARQRYMMNQRRPPLPRPKGLITSRVLINRLGLNQSWLVHVRDDKYIKDIEFFSIRGRLYFTDKQSRLINDYYLSAQGINKALRKEMAAKLFAEWWVDFPEDARNLKKALETTNHFGVRANFKKYTP